MTREVKFGPQGKSNDGDWHPSRQFSARGIPVRTMAGTQRHWGAHASVFRWTGTKWEYDHCFHIHKQRRTTWECSQRLAKHLNNQPKEEA
jgi:hypothetical protein